MKAVSLIVLVQLAVFSAPGVGWAGDASPAVPSTTASPHDPASIDCPLHAAGVNPAGLKPFEDTEKYIAFLERPDRASWQRPDAVVAALGLKGSETVADIGAGSGYFSFRFAKVLPKGKVLAIDIEPEMVRHVHHKAMTESILNVQAILATPDDPKVPLQADLVFICDVLHHVPNREVWLARLFGEMREGAQLVVVEFKEGKLPEGPPEALKISRAKLVAVLEMTGLVLASEQPKLLPYQTFLVFNKPVRKTVSPAARSGTGK